MYLPFLRPGFLKTLISRDNIQINQFVSRGREATADLPSIIIYTSCIFTYIELSKCLSSTSCPVCV